MHVTSLKKPVGYSFINTSKLHCCRSCRYLPLVTLFILDVSEVGVVLSIFPSWADVSAVTEVRTQPKLVEMHFAFQGTLVCTVCVFIHLCHAGQGYKKLICFQCHFLMYLPPWHCCKAPLLRWHLFSRLPFCPFDVFPIWTWLKLQNVCIPVCLLVTCAERQDIKIFQ